jgi:hypothetical protein
MWTSDTSRMEVMIRIESWMISLYESFSLSTCNLKYLFIRIHLL